MAQNQSNMDLIASVIVAYDENVAPVIASQNGRVLSVARTGGIAHGSIDITLIPGEGIDEAALSSSGSLVDAVLTRKLSGPNVKKTGSKEVYTVECAADGVVNTANADAPFSVQLWRKRPI